METVTFVVPLLPGKTEQWREFNGALAGSKATGFADMNKRFGITRHSAWMQETPMGELVIVLQEGSGAKEFMGKLAASEHEFDVWMRKQLSDLHPIDFNAAPPSMPEPGVDWNA